MRKLHCFKCGSDQIDDGSSPVFTVLGVLALIAGSIAALVSITARSLPIDDFGGISQETVIAGFVICYGFMLINEGTKRSERMKCKACGTEFSPPKRVLAIEKTQTR